MTALHVAALCGNVDSATALLDAAADVYSENADGLTVLALAGMMPTAKRHENVRLLLEAIVP